ncbi:MAG: hypothetical protein ABIR71_04015 [Chthoniobacterales bacterium]
MNRISLVVAVLVIASPFAPAAERSSSPPVAYYANDRSDLSPNEAQALTAYLRQHNVVTTGKSQRFTPPRVSVRTYPRTSPGGTLLPNGVVRSVAIVTPEGRVNQAHDAKLTARLPRPQRAWRAGGVALQARAS